MANLMAEEFLGPGYEAPESGGSGGRYLKFKNGTTHFRILSQKALKGWEYWTTDNKPRRVLERPVTTPTDIRIGEDGKPERIRHFWAVTVWDYESSSVKILEITQSTIQKAIIAFVQDADFGHPTKYDLKVSRTGQALETEYNVMPLIKPMPQQAVDSLKSTPVYLEALLHNADPFSLDSVVYATSTAVEVMATTPAAIDNVVLERLSAIRQLTGHNKSQVKSIAASKCKLNTQNASSWTEGDCDRFRDALFVDVASKYDVWRHENHKEAAYLKLLTSATANGPLSDQEIFELWKNDCEARVRAKAAEQDLEQAEEVESTETEEVF